MKKRWVTLVEMIVYLFIASFIWLFIVLISKQFFSSMESSKQIKNFSVWYNDFLKNIYSNWYNWWGFTWNKTDGIWLYNSWLYLWYNCYSTGISISNILTWHIQSSGYYSSYTWFECNSMSWWKYWSGYWLWLNITVSGRKTWLKYFIYSY